MIYFEVRVYVFVFIVFVFGCVCNPVVFHTAIGHQNRQQEAVVGLYSRSNAFHEQATHLSLVAARQKISIVVPTPGGVGGRG